MRSQSCELFTVSLLLALLGSSWSRSVTVDVRAPWARHPLSFLPEISEFVFDGTPEDFWSYAERLCKHNESVDSILSLLRSESSVQPSEALLDQISELQSTAFDAASNVTSKPMQTLMHTMVDFGHYAPSIQFFDTLASEHVKSGAECASGTFLVLYPGATVVCAPPIGSLDVNTLLSQPTDSGVGAELGGVAGSSEWDHIYPGPFSPSPSSAGTTGSSAFPARKAVLYGLVGSSPFCQLHHSLAAAVGSGSLARYSARHYLQAPGGSGAAQGTLLQGFGVFLDIKNMEYKNVDDSATASAPSGEAATVDPTVADWDTLGLNFEKVLEGVPASAFQDRRKDELVPLLRDQLTQAHAQAAGAAADSTMKVWKMHDLGLQTLQQVRTAATLSTPNGAMKKLQEIVHNFPRFASMISATKVSSALREEVNLFYQSMGMNNMHVPPNSVLINGRRTDLGASTFNLFDLLVDLRAELAVTSKLAVLNLPKTIKAQVARIASNVGSAAGGGQGKQKQVRIDVSKGGKNVVSFLNNLEKDVAYRHLPRSLRTLLQPAWSLTALSRNLYTLILVVDPLTQTGASILMQIYMMMQQQYPVRFGLVFNCVSSAPQAQEDFCRLFAQMRSEHSMEYATSFALSVAQSVLEGGEEALDRAFLSRMYVGSVEAVAEQDGGSWLSSSASTAANAKAAAQKEVAALFPADADTGTGKTGATLHRDFVGNTTAYLAARNLPMNSYSLNGIVVSVGEDGQGLNMMMQLLGREQHHVTNLYRRKLISDKTKSLFSAILSQARAYNRFHPMLDEAQPAYVDLAPALLAQVDLIDPAVHPAETETAMDPLASTTLLHLPVSKQGFATAATALQWAIRSAQQKQAVSSGEVEEDGEGQEGSAESLNHRVGFVWQLGGDGAGTCDASLTGSCASVDGDDQEVAEVLAQLHASLTTASKICNADCAAVLLKAFTHLGEKYVPGDDVRAVLHAHLTGLISEQALSTAGASADIASRSHTASRLVSDTLFAGDNAENNALSSASATIVHNGRKLVVALEGDEETGVSGLFEEDLVLLSSLESGRISEDLAPLVRSLAARESAPSSALGAAAKHAKFSALLVQLSTYCGSYNAGGTGPARKFGKGGTHRYDLSSTIEQLESLQGEVGGSTGSGLLYRVEPPASSFATSTDDLQIVVVVDPLTPAGQRAAALIPLLSEQLQYSLTVLFMPRLDISDFPLQNFYRYVTAHSGGGGGEEESVQGANSGAVSGSAAARFTSLPHQHTLTVRMDTPEPWNVQSSVAQQDIDNLRCSASLCGDPASTRGKDSTSVTYALKNVLVAGQCFEGTGAASSGRYNTPPNGLQLTLSAAKEGRSASSPSSSQTSYADTLVMQNLGYFQLQANPGLFVLNTAQGRATELYLLQPDQTGVDASGAKYVAVRTFEDVIHRLLVSKRPGKEHLSLLGEDDEDEADRAGAGAAFPSRSGGRGSNKQSPAHGKKDGGGDKSKGKDGLLSSLSKSLFGGGAGDGSSSDSAALEAVPSVASGKAMEAEDDRIHVFSLATGHMYERLLRIMMLSVTRHSSKPVKFWLFENYLSPSFKQSAAAMAQRYGFEVGYVTYKWPQWLTQQTQQQRIIWGYKILFLDVLFPLNVKKVIYVDADQVVRADLKELWDLDLQGHAYAYTPFCTSREETLGFQFWQQGYWKDHLRGRPYHISALYVVDLQRFRRNAVGDSLRAVYDQLSRDPNSLANLDQDLPNYAQHQVPIFSLPQEWLWCESWCSDESKSTAKTIDLCNNPLHKEPKLDMARRVVSGELFNQSWVQLDDEIRALQSSLGVGAAHE